MAVRRLGFAAGVPLVGLALGIAIAIVSSPASLSPDRRSETSSLVQPAQRALATPSPTVGGAGALGSSARLVTDGSNTIIALGANVAISSADGGHRWIVVRPATNGSGLAVDPSNPSHAVTGGSTIQITTNGGTNWTPSATNPPGKGPYVPLAISPVEPNVWFFIHANKLLITRDGSATWSEISVAQLANAFLVPGQAIGQFYVVSGNRIFELRNYGQTVTEEPSLSSDATELVAVGGPHPTLLARVSNQIYRLQGGGWFPTGRELRGPIAAGAGGTMLIGNGGEKLGVPGAIEYSTDGVSWSSATGLPPDQTVEAIAGQIDSRTFFAYCFGGDVYVSTDGGHAWSLVSNYLRSS